MGRHLDKMDQIYRDGDARGTFLELLNKGKIPEAMVLYDALRGTLKRELTPSDYDFAVGYFRSRKIKLPSSLFEDVVSRPRGLDALVPTFGIGPLNLGRILEDPRFTKKPVNVDYSDKYLS